MDETTRINTSRTMNRIEHSLSSPTCDHNRAYLLLQSSSSSSSHPKFSFLERFLLSSDGKRPGDPMPEDGMGRRIVQNEVAGRRRRLLGERRGLDRAGEMENTREGKWADEEEEMGKLEMGERAKRDGDVQGEGTKEEEQTGWVEIERMGENDDAKHIGQMGETGGILQIGQTGTNGEMGSLGNMDQLGNAAQVRRRNTTDVPHRKTQSLKVRLNEMKVSNPAKKKQTANRDEDLEQRLNRERVERQKLADDVLDALGRLKESTLNVHKNLQEDHLRIRTVDDALGKNLQNVSQVIDRVDLVTNSSSMSWRKMCSLVGFVLAMWVGTYVLIKITPRPS